MLSIGEFSKLCMVTTKTLRYYDSIGLLKPGFQNCENGYRYYELAQLEDMMKISRLQSYEFSLEEIKNLIKSDDETLCNAMRRKLSEKKQQLIIQQHLLHRLNNDIADLQKGDFMKTDFNISLENTKDQNIAFVRETINMKDFCALMERLYALGLPFNGAPIAIYHSKEFNPECTDIEVGYPTSANGENTRILKGSLCVKGVHKGEYSKLSECYTALVKYISDNGYTIIAPPYDKYINNPKNTAPEDLLTEIYFPVKK